MLSNCLGFWGFRNALYAGLDETGAGTAEKEAEIEGTAETGETARTGMVQDARLPAVMTTNGTVMEI